MGSIMFNMIIITPSENIRSLQNGCKEKKILLYYRNPNQH
jgi:hypothetical protein